MDFEAARSNMVEGQLKPNKVNDEALLDVFRQIPRENFVDGANKSVAYVDAPTSMGYGRDMYAPMVCARMLQELELNADDKVLVVAAGTGYSAALASALAGEVYALEENVNLRDVARKAFMDAQNANAVLLEGSPVKGWKAKAPYTKMMIDAPVEEIPQELIDQLAPSGKLACVKRGKSSLLEVVIYTKLGNALFEQVLFETKGKILDKFKREERFEF